jgi:cell pole-organizing protein PopZ
MATEPPTPTLADVAARAAVVCDPGGADDGVADFARRLEDRTEPITASTDIETEVAEVKGAIDPQDEDPAVIMAAAVTVYLAHRRDEFTDAPADLLRLSARAEFDGTPPARVSDWLARQGVTV